MENFVTTYSLWFVPLCLLLGTGYAALLYLREKKYEFTSTYRLILSIFRTVAVSLIAFLLLNPMFRSIRTETEKPIIILLQDNSQSIGTGNDSIYYRTEYPTVLEQFTSEIGEELEVVSYTFGTHLEKGVDLDFTKRGTNIGNALESVYNRFSHKNVGALVLLSDGINNQGLNPLYQQYGFNFPVYTVALGDTIPKRDAMISRINFNRLAYLDNSFPVEVNIQAKKCKGERATLTIERDGKVLYSEKVQFNTPNDFISVSTSLQTSKTGIQKYTVKIYPIEGEVTLNNNVQDFFIDVLEDKQKILLLAAAPHPDIGAIKKSILDNINYELEDYIIEDFTDRDQKYNLEIMHGLPSVRKPVKSTLNSLKEKGIPVLSIITRDVSLSAFNELQTGVVIGREGLVYNEALPVLNKNFNLFGVDDKSRDLIGSLPPLMSPYGSLQVAPTAVSLFYQQVGSVNTGQPLWLFHETLDRKSAVILGPGLWKWRMKEYLLNGRISFFDDLLGKTIQYLALKVDRSLFRVYSENNYEENEAIEIEAELYNEVYELVNEQEVNIIFTGEDGTSYPFTFTQTANAYYLNAGNLPPGSYSYRASVTTGSNRLTETGEFTISSKKIEQMVMEANHNLLLKLAEQYGGELVYPAQIEELASTIMSRDDIRSVSHRSFVYSEMLNNPYLLGFIVLLLSAEWFFRKRAGGY